jgi:hypothetical protein
MQNESIQEGSIPLAAQWSRTHSMGFLALIMTQLGLTGDFDTTTSLKLIEATPKLKSEGKI